MSVRRGEEWGGSGRLPDDGVVVGSNAELLDLVTSHRRAGGGLPPVALTGGDLWRTLGGVAGSERWRTDGAARLTVDLGAALLDGRLHWFAAHLLARGSWLRGRLYAAANAAHLGGWNLAPRAHPGDGLLDVLDADPTLGERLATRRRLPAGTHVPHRAIAYRRTAAEQVEFARPTPVWLDGRRVAAASRISVRVEAEALLVVL